jgi:two-component system LytT family sensor kinase
MVFDSIDQLINNFFSQEVLVTILIAYMLSESMRGIIMLLDRYYSFKRNTKIRVTIQLLVNSAVSVIIVSLVISLYFYFVVESSVFSTELISFNIIYLISVVFYNMLYISIYYLQQHNEMRISKEKLLRSNMESNMKRFRNQINSDFLFGSLETLITLVNTNPDQSEKFINYLSDIYRFKLDNRNEELVDINSEVDVFGKYVFLLNIRYDNSLSISYNIPEKPGNIKLIPGTMQSVIEMIISENIVSSMQPVNIAIDYGDQVLIFKYRKNLKLVTPNPKNRYIDFVERSLLYFTDKKIIRKNDNDFEIIEIPLLEVS